MLHSTNHCWITLEPQQAKKHQIAANAAQTTLKKTQIVTKDYPSGSVGWWFAAFVVNKKSLPKKFHVSYGLQKVEGGYSHTIDWSVKGVEKNEKDSHWSFIILVPNLSDFEHM